MLCNRNKYLIESKDKYQGTGKYLKMLDHSRKYWETDRRLWLLKK